MWFTCHSFTFFIFDFCFSFLENCLQFSILFFFLPLLCRRLILWDAQTRCQRRRTFVRRTRDAVDCASGHVLPRVFFFFFVCQLAPTWLRFRPLCAKLCRLVPNRIVSTRKRKSAGKEKKKKKKT